MRCLILAGLLLVGCSDPEGGKKDGENEESALPTPDALTWELVSMEVAGTPLDLAEDGSVLVLKPRLGGLLLWEGGSSKSLNALTGHTVRFCARKDRSEAVGAYWDTRYSKDVPIRFDLDEDRMDTLEPALDFRGFALTPDGNMLGHYWVGGQARGAVYVEGSPAEDLQSLDGAFHTWPMAASPDGPIAGRIDYDDRGTTHDYVVWDDATAPPQVLPAPGDGRYNIRAIQADGSVVYGSLTDSSGTVTHSVRWVDGAIEDFPAQGLPRQARDVNASNWVLLDEEPGCAEEACGSALFAGGDVLPLDVLPGVDEPLTAWWLNDLGQMVVERQDGTFALLRPVGGEEVP